MTYRKLPQTLYTEISPTPVADPKLYLYNDPLSQELGLDITRWKDASLLSGNHIPEEFTPIAQAYLGHQFGYLAMLGDGRAILLDEIVSPDGKRCDIQLKGSGRTPYSRGGDGRAGLGPMLREYIISEAMHALGIPTSRSLAVVTTGESVYRESPEIGAILTRIASSHIRVGTFQYASHKGVVKELADYTIARHYPECAITEEPYVCLLNEAIKRQAKLIAQWQSVGFIHGVMNTDNMSLAGETIDYGPCAFIDTFKADQVFSSIDRQGRYRYSQQAPIAQWNLARFAETLLELIDSDHDQAIERATELLGSFEEHYYRDWTKLFGKKLGLTKTTPEDRPFLEEFLKLLEKEALDFTNAFIALSGDPTTSIFTSEEGIKWHSSWLDRIDQDRARDIMRKTNPRVIPRNLKLDEAIKAAEAGDPLPFDKLLAVVQKPFAETVSEEYTQGSNPGECFITYCGT